MAEFANTTNSSILSTSSYNHTTPSGTKSPDESTITLVLITYVGLLVGIIFFALLGNVLVILVFLFDKRLRVSTSYYMLSLAVSDVITAAIVMPLELDQVLNGYKWRHSQVLCQTWTTAYLFTVPVSILTWYGYIAYSSRSFRKWDGILDILPREFSPRIRASLTSKRIIPYWVQRWTSFSHRSSRPFSTTTCLL